MPTKPTAMRRIPGRTIPAPGNKLPDDCTTTSGYQPMSYPPTPPTSEKIVGNKKLLLTNKQCPGDGVMLAYAVKSLKEAYGNNYAVDVNVGYPDLFEGLYEDNTLTKFDRSDKDVREITLKYETIHTSNQRLYFYLDGMRNQLSLELGIPIPPCEHSGFLSLRNEEKSWYSAVYEELGYDVPYWVINAGYKTDYAAKQWSFIEYQKLIEMHPDTVFVQIGLDTNKHPNHIHAPLSGDNVINMLGKTDNRQLVRLVYNSYGVISPCSLLMLLGYAVPPHPRFGRKSRANIAIAGGREPNHWHQGPNAQYLHTCGMLPCCDYGGCWCSRVKKLGDGNQKDSSLCHFPVELSNGQVVGKCMDMIKAEDVSRLVSMYIASDKFESGTSATPYVA